MLIALHLALLGPCVPIMLLPLGLLALVGVILLVLRREVIHIILFKFHRIGTRIIFITVVVALLVVASVAHIVVDLLCGPVLRVAAALADSSTDPSTWPQLGLSGVALALGVASASDSTSNASAYSTTLIGLPRRSHLSGPRIALLFVWRCL